MNDAKVKALYTEFYKAIGVSAAWAKGSSPRIYQETRVFQGASKKQVIDKARLARIANRAPEVMVKVSGRTYDTGHMRAHMDYITRNGELPAETDYGPMMGREAIDDLHEDWSDDAQIYGEKLEFKKAPLTVNIVLSMPPGTDRDRFRNAVRDFVDTEIRSRADVMVAFHDDTDHPHAHVTVRGRGHNGRTFNPGKPVLEKYRERFASSLRARGVEAEATPRFARGKTQLAERQKQRHMRARGVTPRNDDRAFREALDAQQNGRPPKQQPWKSAVREKQLGVRHVYKLVAYELARSHNVDDKKLAAQVTEFVAAMPQSVTRQDRIEAAMDKHLQGGGRQAVPFAHPDKSLDKDRGGS